MAINLYRYFLIIILLLIPFLLEAQTEKKTKWVDIGFGAVYGPNSFGAVAVFGTAGVQIADIYYVSLRAAAGSACFSEGCTTTNTGMAEIGGLFGVMKKMRKGMFRTGAGISYSYVEADEADPKSGIGIPIEGQASFLMGPIGLGAYLMGNINTVNSYFGGGLLFSVVF